ncbi:hypothetical protein CEXT_698451 [Caerostris extrusa]|uniref:Uncharacterized protein n=1 Tax=Caerostris extrusa TaxID=172846 RepID=A0AAV4VSM0_CAEEX|nr:hypothetical protein CEXT_698451 [Caerostris extrusa]
MKDRLLCTAEVPSGIIPLVTKLRVVLSEQLLVTRSEFLFSPLEGHGYEADSKKRKRMGMVEDKTGQHPVSPYKKNC